MPKDPAVNPGMTTLQPAVKGPAGKPAAEKDKPKSTEKSVDKRPAAKTSVEPAAAKAERLLSLDAYRGFIMLAMASAGFGLASVAKNQPADSLWHSVAFQFQHVGWRTTLNSFSCWDLIQPAFMFMVGVAMPYSYASRRSRGDSYGKLLLHALIRAFVLVALGIFLQSQSPHTEPNFVFTNVLAQIGLGYLFVFLLANRPAWLQVLAVIAILGGYGYAFYQYPARPPEHAEITKVPAEETLAGMQAHWNADANLAGDVDRKFLNLLPRSKPYEASVGAYQTLNFVPSMATMILGLLAGGLLRSNRTPRAKLLWLIGGGALCVALGVGLGMTICPVVKKIWTPSWALFSGGLVLWMLAAFYAVIDMAGFRRLAFPLAIVGVNSLLVYMMSQLMRGWTATNLKIWFGQGIFSGPYGPIVQSVGVLTVFWLICLWLYRQRVFIRI